MPEKILYGVLDWGLGHATRSVPIIEKIIAEGCDITVAASGRALIYLKKEFPNLTFLELPELEIVYPKNEKPGNWSFVLKGILNYPRLQSYFKQCQEVTTKYTHDRTIKAIISDGHFGVFSEDARNVILSHQLNLKAGVFGSTINRINQTYLNRYDEIWVPDFENERTLAGDLSKRGEYENVHYLGPLTSCSHFEFEPFDLKRLLILLSGPEPQRTILERRICKELKGASKLIKSCHVDLVSGTSQNKELDIEGITHHRLLNSDKVSDLINKSDLVVCRSGYSSIMDLFCLGKRAVLIPTPGQGEQEYLASYHHGRNNFTSVDQARFELKDIIDRLNEPAHIHSSDFSGSALDPVSEFLRTL